MVKTLDIDLKFANNGEEAVILYKEYQPDIIFMDISMPKMDGKQACKAIRDYEHHSEKEPIPIVALTAHAINGDKDDILAVGMNRYLTKPLKKDEIMGAISDYAPDRVSPKPTN